MMYARPKAPTFGRRSKPAEKEQNRAQRLTLRAQRAIESVAVTSRSAAADPRREKSKKAQQGHDIIAQPATNFVASIPKVARLRNRRLLALAKGMPCLLRVPDVCNRDPATVVACHSNWREHGGKGAHRKADDCYTVWGCHACHTWLDTGGTAGSAKESRFMLAHADQVLMWRQIACDTQRPEADRKAAKWALKQLNATPLTPEAEGLSNPIPR